MTVKKNPQELPTILRFRLKKAGTKILLFFIFATSISHPFEARGNSKFDSAFYHIAVNLAGSDVSKALHSADSLFLASIDDLERIRSKMLLASLQSQIGKRDNAIQNAIDAEVMASNHDWHDWQARICGFLSTQFRNAGMIKEGSHYLEKGLKASSLLTSPEEMHRLSGLAYQEKAYYAMLEKKNREAIEFLLNSENRFEQLPDDRNKFFFLATNGELLGKNYIQIDKLNLAQTQFENAIDNIEKAEGTETALLGFIYNGLGRINLLNGELETAYSFFAKAEEIANNADFHNLNLEVYEQLANYFQEIGDLEKFALYSLKMKEALIKEKESSSSSAETLVRNLRLTEEEKSQSNSIIGGVLICFVLIIMGGYTYKKRKLKKKEKDFQLKNHIGIKTDLPEKNIRPELTIQHEKPIVEKTSDKKIRIKDMMPAETEEMLLRKLKAFESKQRYTERGLSLPALAASMKTNTKYLSYVINKHKCKGFNSYINEMRIQFILTKMEEDNKYLQYKISYLAEEAGFSSHSKFAMVFKQVTGLSPSGYMESIKQEKVDQSS